MAERITVDAPGGSYDIVIEPGLLQRADDYTAQMQLAGKMAVVANETIAPIYGESLAATLPGAALITIPDGERFKTLETVEKLYADFISAELDRSSTVVALGGGVVGDTVGFAAATFMRGLRLIQIPTSLLAMVDSSVGGKVGVDLPQGKNLVGAFKQPAAVWIDSDVLGTLPPEQWRFGMAEVIKHGLLADPALLDPALHVLARAPELIRRAVQVKVATVQADPFEQGVRAHLNLGHTFAHAIELVSDYAWQHGAAVGVGLLAAAHLSQRLGLCDERLIAEVETVLQSVGLPRRLHGIDSAALYTAMKTDKKWRDGRSRFVVLSGLGQATIIEDVPAAAVLGALDALQ